MERVGGFRASRVGGQGVVQQRRSSGYLTYLSTEYVFAVPAAEGLSLAGSESHSVCALLQLVDDEYLSRASAV